MDKIAKNNVIKLSVGAIILWTLVTFIAWVIGINVFTKVQFIFPFVPYLIVGIVLVLLQMRKSYGGYISFKQGLQFAFLTYVIYEVAIGIITYILFNVIDPSLTTQLLEKSLQSVQSFMESSGVPEEEIEKAMDKAMKEGSETNAKNIVLGIGYSLIFSFIKSAIIAAIVKRDKEPFNDQL